MYDKKINKYDHLYLKPPGAQSQNVLIEKGGPTPYTHHNINDSMSTFMCLMDITSVTAWWQRHAGVERRAGN